MSEADREKQNHSEIPAGTSSTTIYLSFTGTIQTLLCTIIGFGIISLPYSVKIVGSMSIAICVHIACTFILLMSTIVYLIVRSNMQ